MDGFLNEEVMASQGRGKKTPIRCMEENITGREKMTETLFENFSSPAMMVCCDGLLSMVSSGAYSGIIVSSGDGVTHIFPIFGIHEIPHAIRRVDIGGRDVTGYLCKLLAERGYSFTTTAERETVRDLKEKLCDVATDFDEMTSQSYQSSSSFEKIYELPDGRKITIGNERFRCTEVMFRPEMLGLDVPSIHELVYESIMACDIDIRSHFFDNVILSGGNTMFPNFTDRMKKEMAAQIPKGKKLSVVHPPERKYSVWIGGSIVACSSCYKNQWITKDIYEECGPSVVNRRFTCTLD